MYDTRKQYLATLSVNLISISYGISCGWTSVTIPLLQSIDSPIGPQSEEVLSWLVAIMCIGGFIGTIFFGWVTNVFGRNKPLWCLWIPAVISWQLILFATNVTHVLIARFLIGFVGGGCFVIVPVFIVEISETHIRGLLSSALFLSCNIGVVVAFVVGNYFSFTVAHIIYSVFPILFCISTYFLPETPVYLIKANKPQAARDSLNYYRNMRESSEEDIKIEKAELQKLKDTDSDTVDTSLKLSDFTSHIAIKAILISLGLVALNQLCGCFALISYTSTIFKESGSTMSPNMSAIIVGIIQIVGNTVASNMVERAGRKIIMFSSALGTGIGLVALGAHGYVKYHGYDVSGFSWVPIVSFSFVIFIASWGVLSLPFVIISEILPEKIRLTGLSICSGTLWIFSFLSLKYFYFVSNLLGLHGVLFVFSSCSFIGALFVVIFVPETKGKSIAEIMKML